MSTYEVSDAELYYEVRGSGPLVVLVGAPMDADAFAPLADLLAPRHTVLTLDPRGVKRSTLAPGGTSRPEQRADDLAQLIRHVDAGPAVVLGSSGGAVTALALAQYHPEVVRTVIAHEPPLDRLLPDADELLAKSEKLMADYRAGDVVGAWKQFFQLANIFLPGEVAEAMFGGDRDPKQVADERFWFDHEMRESITWLPDVDRLREVDIVVGIGADSTGQLCERTSTALAGLLGVEPVRYPGGHTGMVDAPETFAEAFRAELEARGETRP
ncbi:pimeloyl-ACP methyl ester carboxylesterase [Kribbella aluminosa]|uniref:Pimeloyl-ACP methyl ester carboxylesterase n=1 Tax=Kribbella aluminosa TaxID=416017 RepID=A0ABS4UEB7_9ACTN|nr:alpha/beta hydrolase [Kribbella aluminosa]MBP2349993.1 pimeloyl-ACP methyl ester carboxylesterase [Kribbella aluminosa]